MHEDLTFPVRSGAVNVYINAFGEHVIPHEVIAEALRLNKGKSVFDSRTRGYRVIRKWADKVDIESAREWENG